MAAAGQLALAEKLACRSLLRCELKAAGGMGKGAPKIAANGLSQVRNVWLLAPKFPLFNHHWPTYAFKNMYRFSPVLGDRRIAISQPLIGKARLLWEIIRSGESAVP